MRPRRRIRKKNGPEGCLRLIPFLPPLEAQVSVAHENGPAGGRSGSFSYRGNGRPRRGKASETFQL